MKTTEYQLRAVRQSEQWAYGRAVHNAIDDECCPDFSCCVPRLFEQDRAKRVAEHNAYCERHNFAQYKIVDA